MPGSATDQPEKKKRGRPPLQGAEATAPLRIAASQEDAAWFRETLRQTGLTSGGLLGHLIEAYEKGLRADGAKPPRLRRIRK